MNKLFFACIASLTFFACMIVGCGSDGRNEIKINTPSAPILLNC